MSEMVLIDSEFCTYDNDVTRPVVSSDGRASRHSYRGKIKEKKKDSLILFDSCFNIC